MGCLQRNMDELWLFCHWNRTREVVFSLWSVENCHLFKRESLITLNKTASGVGTTFLHLDWLHIRKEMRSLSKCSQHRQAGHLKGLFVIPPPPTSQAVVYFYHWPLDRLEMTRVATGPAFLSLPFWHCAVGVGAAEQDIHEWENGRFYGGETGPGLSFPDGLFQGRYHLSPSHLLKIAPHSSPAKAKQTGHGKGFYF